MSRRSERRSALRDPKQVEELAQVLKERVYATFTGLAIVLVLRGGGEHAATASSATFTLAVGVLGITVAGFAAEVIAHLAVHGALPDRVELSRMLRIAGGALGSASVPILFLVLAWVGWMELETALRVGTVVYLATLGLIGYAAVRRTTLVWWKQLAALAALVLLGALVVVLQLLAHS